MIYNIGTSLNFNLGGPITGLSCCQPNFIQTPYGLIIDLGGPITAVSCCDPHLAVLADSTGQAALITFRDNNLNIIKTKIGQKMCVIILEESCRASDPIFGE